MKSTIVEAAGRLERWMTEEALPLWQERGLSPEGGHWEALNADGSVDEQANIRVRVLARQAFSFAFGTARQWCHGEAMARQLMAFVTERAAHPSAGGGFTHLMNPAFEVIDTRQDLYDHAFFLLAYSWCYRAFGDDSFLKGAEALMAHLDHRFGSVYGGWTEGDYAYTQRRQNPHMHLFEAMMSLHEATGDAKWLARAGELFALFQSRYFDPEREVLFEFFEDDWTLKHAPNEAPIEPGHMFEWVWLLDWYRRLTGQSVTRYTEALYRKAMDIGQVASGLVWDEVRLDGTPLKYTKRCWGLTEFIKASLVRAREGDAQAEARAVEAIDTLFTYYLTAQTPGAYVDQRGADDEVLIDKAPASTLYHLVVLTAEVSDYVRRRHG
ncbi:AGE family epimerase/isomerase [Marinimicrobium sp. ARAG 43.8]|uniref:AGE family epimerase/isomerase n=1 Tax=Marinimicrobium sp. ARAG 43.8 TaxID=3418719 RepID=UPI003CF048AB